jgi:uncharacterized membrane protein HdeD (DUF308 family)
MHSTPELSLHEKLETCLRHGFSRRWRWRLAEGTCFVLLGVVCLLAAPRAGPEFMGTVLLASGAVTLFAIWRTDQYPAFALSLLMVLAAFMTGGHLLQGPPAAGLGLAFAAYFACRGVVTILLSGAHRRLLFSQWEWFAVSGVTSLILAMLILSGLPGPYTWMLGLLLGVDLIFDGSSVLAVTLASNVAPAIAPARSFHQDRPAGLQHAPAYEDGIHV